MKKLIVILSFAVLLGCATTQPPVPVSQNIEQEEDLPKKTKSLGEYLRKEMPHVFGIVGSLLF